MIRRPDCATIEGSCGGSCSGLSEIPACVPHDVMVYYDAAREQATANIDPGVICIPSGEGETLRTIVSDFPNSKLQAFVNRRPGMPADDGMAATPALGFANVTRLLKDERTWQLIRSLCYRVFQARGGHIPRLVINMRAGTAGGQGSLTTLPLGLAIAQPFLERGVAVHVHIHRVGALTYDGIRDDARLDINNASTVLQDLYEIHHAAEAPPLLTVERTFLEIPPVKRNKSLRDYYVRTISQAYAAYEVKKITQTSGSNEATSSDLGNVNVIQGEWFHRIENPAIAQCVALCYLPPIQKLIRSRPPAGLIASIRLSSRRNRAPTMLFEEFYRHLSGPADHDQLMEAARTPEVEYRCVGYVVLADGTRIDLEDLPDYLNQPTVTFEAFSRRKHLVDALAAEFKAQLIEIKLLYRRAKRKLIYEAARFCFWLFLTKPLWRWQMVVGAFFTQHSKYARLRKWFERFRLAASEVARLQATIKFVRSLRRFLKRESAENLRTLRKIGRSLRPFYPLQRVPLETRPVTIISIDDAFEQLKLLHPESRFHNETLLARLVERVTLNGLAQIMGAAVPRVEAIAALVLNGSAPVVGPPWGNRRRLYRGVTIMALPPVDDQLKGQLLKQISKLDRTALVAIGDTAVGGVTAVRLHIATPLSVAENGHREVLTPYLQNSLAGAKQQPELNFPRGTEPLAWLRNSAESNGHLDSEDK